MKVLFAALFVLVSVTLVKGDAIDKAWKKLCKINKEMPGKMNEIKECDRTFLSGKSELLPGAVRECEKAKYSTSKFDEFLNAMCSKEREADLQEVKECIREKFAEAQVDPEIAVTGMMKNCF
ncbi:uncharacterized protein LOC106475494 [Limulus polyphemus]|uniref:Uncharacterized protein LOC106475494 n=1 Tax=Limulus polyphemus TaxID=6850 RepID=A0ABM1BZJ4_LIMPO|nr:uncharacterized protein LOC106475494 [Limulus polyphemus]